LKQETKDLLVAGWVVVTQVVAIMSGIAGLVALIQGDYSQATFNMLMMHILSTRN